MKRILVVNPKGGCGKTTIASNLASYYAVWEVPTCLVDYDPQLSSTNWLASRPEDCSKIESANGTRGNPNIPAGTQRVIMDAPARISDTSFKKLSKEANVIIIPVLPSPIDIRAASQFLADVLSNKPDSKTKIGLVANRVKENTKIYTRLEEFLKEIKIPFITYLRDSQNYIHAVDKGIGIFEMTPSQVDPDIEQWRPLIKWIERGKK
ncbi:MAG: ParA family protein [Arenicellales bacterium WSBS_2016_MAG_OTU3]